MPSVQPDYSPGMIVAAVVLVLTYEYLSWWLLLIIIAIPPIVNGLLVGQTHKKEVHIEDDY